MCVKAHVLVPLLSNRWGVDEIRTFSEWLNRLQRMNVFDNVVFSYIFFVRKEIFVLKSVIAV